MDEYKLTVCQSWCVQQHRLFFWTDLPLSQLVNKLETIFNIYLIRLNNSSLAVTLIQPTGRLFCLNSLGKARGRTSTVIIPLEICIAYILFLSHCLQTFLWQIPLCYSRLQERGESALREQREDSWPWGCTKIHLHLTWAKHICLTKIGPIVHRCLSDIKKNVLLPHKVLLSNITD